jgi:hypothetical protein
MRGRSIPERIALNVRLPRGEEGYWQIIRVLDARGAWTVSDIDGESCDNRNCIGKYVKRLVMAGFARHVGDKIVTARGLARVKEYKLLKSPKAAPRIRTDGTVIVSTQQECLWRAIRALKGGFNVRELAFAASIDAIKIREAAAQRYVELLAGAGYLALLQARKGRHGLNTWRLKPAMNTGPLSPTILRAEAIFDRNLRKVMGEPASSVVAS